MNYKQGDALNFDFRNITYDVVVSQEVLEHIEDKPNYIKVCYDVLKSGGYLILTTPNKNVLDHMMDGKTWSNQPVELPITKGELKTLLNQNNFKIINYESIIMNFGNKGLYNIINHSYIVAGFRQIGLGKLRELILSKQGFDLHHCILAQKQ